MRLKFLIALCAAALLSMSMLSEAQEERYKVSPTKPIMKVCYDGICRYVDGKYLVTDDDGVVTLHVFTKMGESLRKKIMDANNLPIRM